MEEVASLVTAAGQESFPPASSGILLNGASVWTAVSPPLDGSRASNGRTTGEQKLKLLESCYGLKPPALPALVGGGAGGGGPGCGVRGILRGGARRGSLPSAMPLSARGAGGDLHRGGAARRRRGGSGHEKARSGMSPSGEQLLMPSASKKCLSARQTRDHGTSAGMPPGSARNAPFKDRTNLQHSENYKLGGGKSEFNTPLQHGGVLPKKMGDGRPGTTGAERQPNDESGLQKSFSQILEKVNQIKRDVCAIGSSSRQRKRLSSGGASSQIYWEDAQSEMNITGPSPPQPQVSSRAPSPTAPAEEEVSVDEEGHDHEVETDEEIPTIREAPIVEPAKPPRLPTAAPPPIPQSRSPTESQSGTTGTSADSLAYSLTGPPGGVKMIASAAAAPSLQGVGGSPGDSEITFDFTAKDIRGGTTVEDANPSAVVTPHVGGAVPLASVPPLSSVSAPKVLNTGDHQSSSSVVVSPGLPGTAGGATGAGVPSGINAGGSSPEDDANVVPSTTGGGREPTTSSGVPAAADDDRQPLNRSQTLPALSQSRLSSTSRASQKITSMVQHWESVFAENERKKGSLLRAGADSSSRIFVEPEGGRADHDDACLHKSQRKLSGDVAVESMYDEDTVVVGESGARSTTWQGVAAAQQASVLSTSSDDKRLSPADLVIDPNEELETLRLEELGGLPGVRHPKPPTAPIPKRRPGMMSSSSSLSSSSQSGSFGGRKLVISPEQRISRGDPLFRGDQEQQSDREFIQRSAQKARHAFLQRQNLSEFVEAARSLGVESADGGSAGEIPVRSQSLGVGPPSIGGLGPSGGGWVWGGNRSAASTSFISGAGPRSGRGADLLEAPPADAGGRAGEATIRRRAGALWCANGVDEGAAFFGIKRNLFDENKRRMLEEEEEELPSSIEKNPADEIHAQDLHLSDVSMSSFVAPMGLAGGGAGPSGPGAWSSSGASSYQRDHSLLGGAMNNKPPILGARGGSLVARSPASRPTTTTSPGCASSSFGGGGSGGNKSSSFAGSANNKSTTAALESKSSFSSSLCTSGPTSSGQFTHFSKPAPTIGAGYGFQQSPAVKRAPGADASTAHKTPQQGSSSGGRRAAPAGGPVVENLKEEVFRGSGAERTAALVSTPTVEGRGGAGRSSADARTATPLIDYAAKTREYLHSVGLASSVSQQGLDLTFDGRCSPPPGVRRSVRGTTSPPRASVVRTEEQHARGSEHTTVLKTAFRPAPSQQQAVAGARVLRSEILDDFLSSGQGEESDLATPSVSGGNDNRGGPGLPAPGTRSENREVVPGFMAPTRSTHKKRNYGRLKSNASKNQVVNHELLRYKQQAAYYNDADESEGGGGFSSASSAQGDNRRIFKPASRVKPANPRVAKSSRGAVVLAPKPSPRGGGGPTTTNANRGTNDLRGPTAAPPAARSFVAPNHAKAASNYVASVASNGVASRAGFITGKSGGGVRRGEGIGALRGGGIAARTPRGQEKLTPRLENRGGNPPLPPHQQLEPLNRPTKRRAPPPLSSHVPPPMPPDSARRRSGPKASARGSANVGPPETTAAVARSRSHSSLHSESSLPERSRHGRVQPEASHAVDVRAAGGARDRPACGRGGGLAPHAGRGGRRSHPSAPAGMGMVRQHSGVVPPGAVVQRTKSGPNLFGGGGGPPRSFVPPPRSEDRDWEKKPRSYVPLPPPSKPPASSNLLPQRSPQPSPRPQARPLLGYYARQPSNLVPGGGSAPRGAAAAHFGPHGGHQQRAGGHFDPDQSLVAKCLKKAVCVRNEVSSDDDEVDIVVSDESY